MDNKNFAVCKGLKHIHTAQIATIIAGIFSIVAFFMILTDTAFVSGSTPEMEESLSDSYLLVTGVESIVALVCFILHIIGLAQAGSAHNDYKSAIPMIIIKAALGFFDYFFVRNVIMDSTIKVASIILVFFSVYFVLNATISLLREKNDEANIAKGFQVRLIYIVATTVNVLLELVLVSFIMPWIEMFLLLTSTIIQFIALCLYIGFLNRSRRSLSEEN